MEDLRRPKGKEQRWQGEHNTRGRANKPFCPSVWLSEPWNLVPSFSRSVFFTSAFTEGPGASKEIRFIADICSWIFSTALPQPGHAPESQALVLAGLPNALI